MELQSKKNSTKTENLHRRRMSTVLNILTSVTVNQRQGKMGGLEGRWAAKMGDGWLRGEMGGEEGRWVAKRGDGWPSGEMGGLEGRWGAKRGDGWQRGEMGGQVGRWVA